MQPSNNVKTHLSGKISVPEAEASPSETPGKVANRNSDPMKSGTKNGLKFWEYIRTQLTPDELHPSDKQVLQDLCTPKSLVDTIPKGLLASYMYLYNCVRGLGCEDAEVIERDVLRTVGAVKDGPKVFQDTTDLGKAGAARAMHRLLTSISITDGMGYCQGMNYVVDFLLKIVSEEHGFCLFLHALRNKHLCCLYETKLPVLSDYMEAFELQLALRRPVLAATLKEKGFLAPFYSIEWFTTMFTLACPPELTLAIWDMFYFGVKDIQLRCAVAMMEVMEPLLLPLSTEQLLKQFRSFSLHVNVTDVVLRAFRMQLGVVHLPSNEPSHRTKVSFMMDPKSYMMDAYGDALLTLRHKYIVEAGQVMRERELGAEKWASESGRGSESSSNSDRQHSLINGEGSKLLAQLCDKIDEDYVVLSQSDVAPSRFISSTKDSDDESIEAPAQASDDVSALPTSASDSPAAALYRPTEAEINAFSSTTFDFFLDMELTNKTAELRELIVATNRIYLWPELNQKWDECLQFIKSDLSKYNLADYMLRYAISKKAHVRVISFFLAVGADPNSQDRMLRTPLHYAAALNRPDVARLLLLCGADVCVPGALCSLRQTSKSYSLATPIELLTNAIPHVSYSVLLWPAVLVVLRKKCCLMCNTLFSAMVAGRDKRLICPMCECAFCINCVPNHLCVWNVEIVRAKYESGLEKCGIEPKSAQLQDNRTNLSTPPPKPQHGSLDLDECVDDAASSTAALATPDGSKLKKNLSFKDQAESSPRQLRSRLRSLSMNSFNSNNSPSPTPPMRSQTPPPMPIPVLAPTPEKYIEEDEMLNTLPAKRESKRIKFSQKFKSQFKRIAKRLSIAAAPEEECTNSVNIEEAQVPLYWVGYKYSDHYLSHMTPWQLYILPLLYGAEQKYLSSCNTQSHSHADADSRHFRSADVPADTYLEHAQTAISSLLQIPPSNAEAIHCNTNEPQELYFGSEMEGYYGLMQRDYVMFSSPIVELNHDSPKERNSENSTPRTPAMKRRSLPIEMERLHGGVSMGIADVRPITESLSALSIRRIIANFLTGHWTIDENSAIWIKDECSWHCKQCFVQFSIFQRKHHCRRCGGVFCSDDAVLLDALECVPDELREMARILLAEFPEKKQFRLCRSCYGELRLGLSLMHHIERHMSECCWSHWHEQMMKLSFNAPVSSLSNDNSCSTTTDLKDVKFRRFPRAGHWVDSMTDWFSKDRYPIEQQDKW